MEELAQYLFHQGTNFSAYEYLGCNLVNKDNSEYVYSFRTWAPSADSVSLISDFTGWDTPIRMHRINKSGIWELIYKSTESLERKAYKFAITKNNKTVNKGDPYARGSRGSDDGASLIYAESYFEWKDEYWLSYRNKVYSRNNSNYLSCPINIYEVHLGSFARHEDNSYLSYREIADILSEYVKKMGYTHVELLPMQEYPFDPSWGYQVGAFYAPTSRFGEPDDLRYFVNKMHSLGIGVILDWVPAHFPRDEWGLFEFDGAPLYEYQGKDRQNSPSWGTRFFDLGREEVQSFLISNAEYFIKEFHFDGLRVDAVASMLYLDFDRKPGEWIPNETGGNINREAESFIKKLNRTIQEMHPDVLTVAEESTAFSNVTKSIDHGGLGFSMKWNMGFANDFYDYMSTDPIYRKYKHSALNFPLMYAFSERYCLPISHDEVVHGKKSFIDKMYGSYEDKFNAARASLLYIMTFPGKKLIFMGTEFAQFREWDFENSLEWFMLDYDNHRYFRDYVKELNRFYLTRKELWELDFDNAGFSWLSCDDSDQNSIAYRRYDSIGNHISVALNFSGSESVMSLDTDKAKDIDILFTTGNLDVRDLKNKMLLDSEKSKVIITLPPLSAVVYKEINGQTKMKI